MKLSEFLKLTPDEELLKATFQRLSLIKKARLISEFEVDSLDSLIFHNITEMSLDTTLKMAFADPEFNQVCMLPGFENLWEQQWRQCGPLVPIPIEYLPMRTVSCFDLLKGLFVYEGYRKLLKEKDTLSVEVIFEAEKYLTLAADCGCFFALNALCVEGLKQLPTLSERDIVMEKIDKIIEYAKKCANVYWAPGYLLLSNVLQELTLITGACIDIDEEIYKKYLFVDAMEALYMAQHPRLCIHNAYQGKTIKEASHNEITSYFLAKIHLRERANGLLSSSDIEMVINAPRIG